MDNNVEVGKDGRKDKDGHRAYLWDYQVETAGLQSSSTENDSRGHCSESQSMMERSSMQITWGLKPNFPQQKKQKNSVLAELLDGFDVRILNVNLKI